MWPQALVRELLEERQMVGLSLINRLDESSSCTPVMRSQDVPMPASNWAS